jgi:hypothetical protein
MSEQNYKNHVRYYPAHHFIFYPLITAMLVFIARRAYVDEANRVEWLVIGALTIFVIFLSFMTRQHYALGNQNRLVRMEMRFRYYVLTGKRLELLESKLSFGQVAALRFASDAELPELVDRALKENMTPKEIKKAIRNWEPDYMRV